ncbi:hypothetical protein [Halalkalibacterium halodurans]|uniref:hypothetical protein n=1 Tax=Halalkalibacterium halodurans TaxID=86665 RepID=UPI001F28A377|nr:hypothetical protein [Halalkalibacterium halodurans]
MKVAKTPYRDLASESILSAHLSGVQHDVNKIQDVLGMKTDVKENHPLLPVTDQEDSTLRFRIYEADIRNWTTQPEPVIYRDGTVVDPGEYELYPAYGAVVFVAQQHTDAEVTADFTHIIGEANILDDIAQHAQEIEQIKENMQGPGSGTEEAVIRVGGVEPFYPVAGTYLSHYRRDYNPIIESGYHTESHRPAFGILVYGNTIDAFPFPITRKTTFVRAGLCLRNGNGTVRAKVGIYADDGTGRPSNLIFQSPEMTIAADGGWGYADLQVELQPGLYWIARHDGADAYWNGLHQMSAIPLMRFNGETFLQNLAERPNPHTVFGGYRATNITYGNMPQTFPTSGELFRRDYYCSPWLITG